MLGLCCGQWRYGLFFGSKGIEAWALDCSGPCELSGCETYIYIIWEVLIFMATRNEHPDRYD